MKLARLALAGVVLAALALLAWGCDQQDIEGQNEAARGNGGEVEQRTGTIDIFDLRTGHCFAEPLSTDDEYWELELFECDDPRADYEVSDMFVVDEDDAFPGESWLDEAAFEHCPSTYDSYLGPTSESWEYEDRTVICLEALH